MPAGRFNNPTGRGGGSGRSSRYRTRSGKKFNRSSSKGSTPTESLPTMETPAKVDVDVLAPVQEEEQAFGGGRRNQENQKIGFSFDFLALNTKNLVL